VAPASEDEAVTWIGCPGLCMGERSGSSEVAGVGANGATIAKPAATEGRLTSPLSPFPADSATNDAAHLPLVKYNGFSGMSIDPR
jgi:hypothetical protein